MSENHRAFTQPAFEGNMFEVYDSEEDEGSTLMVRKRKKNKTEVLRPTIRVDPNQLVSRKPSLNLSGTLLLKTSSMRPKRRKSYSKPVHAMLLESRHPLHTQQTPLSPPGSVFTRVKSKILGKTFSDLSLSSNHPHLMSLDFDVFSKSPSELENSISSFVKEFSLGKVFMNDFDTLWNLVTGIRHNYLPNPFHNFQHAFSVAHTVCLFFHNTRLLQSIGRNHALALLIAGLGHDLNHPGTDNSFELSSNSSLAIFYQKSSVLENLHAATLLELMSRPEMNVFKYLSLKKQATLKEFMVEAVIATDMKYHAQSVKALKNKQGNKVSKRICFAILHASDVSGQCGDLDVAKQWEERIYLEMDAQRKKMEEKGLDVPKHMLIENRGTSQLQFIDYMLEPLWKEVACVFEGMRPLYNNLTQVVRQYYFLLSTEGEEAAEEHAASCSAVPISQDI